MTPEGERDAIDLLFARLDQVEPPADLVARVMARARQGEAARWPRWQQALFGFGYLAALIALGALSFLTGVELERSHLRDLVSLAVQDATSVTESPGLYFSALRDAIPWAHVAAVLGDVLLLAVATRFVLRLATPRGESGLPAVGSLGWLTRRRFGQAGCRTRSKGRCDGRVGVVGTASPGLEARQHRRCLRPLRRRRCARHEERRRQPIAAGRSTPPPVVQKLSEHYLVGTIVEALTPGRAIIRTQNGRFVVVEYDRETAVRRNGKAAPFVALRRGTRVIILGTPRDGRLHANVVTITGVAPPRQLPAIAPSLVSPSPASTRPPAPTRSATPVRLDSVKSSQTATAPITATPDSRATTPHP